MVSSSGGEKDSRKREGGSRYKGVVWGGAEAELKQLNGRVV